MAAGIGTISYALNVLMRWNFGKADASQSSQVVLTDMRMTHAKVVRPGRSCMKEDVSP